MMLVEPGDTWRSGGMSVQVVFSFWSISAGSRQVDRTALPTDGAFVEHRSGER